MRFPLLRPSEHFSFSSFLRSYDGEHARDLHDFEEINEWKLERMLRAKLKVVGWEGRCIESRRETRGYSPDWSARGLFVFHRPPPSSLLEFWSSLFWKAGRGPSSVRNLTFPRAARDADDVHFDPQAKKYKRYEVRAHPRRVWRVQPSPSNSQPYTSLATRHHSPNLLPSPTFPPSLSFPPSHPTANSPAYSTSRGCTRFPTITRL